MSRKLQDFCARRNLTCREVPLETRKGPWARASYFQVNSAVWPNLRLDAYKYMYYLVYRLIQVDGD